MELKGLNRWDPLPLGVIILLTLSPLTDASAGESLTMRVYSDGYVSVTQDVASQLRFL